MSEQTGAGIEIEFFASLREAVGHARLSMPESTALGMNTVDDVRAWVARRVPDASKLYAQGVRTAVNDEFAELRDRIGVGDRVAFLPRVTGG